MNANDTILRLLIEEHVTCNLIFVSLRVLEPSTHAPLPRPDSAAAISNKNQAIAPLHKANFIMIFVDASYNTKELVFNNKQLTISETSLLSYLPDFLQYIQLSFFSTTQHLASFPTLPLETLPECKKN